MKVVWSLTVLNPPCFDQFEGALQDVWRADLCMNREWFVLCFCAVHQLRQEGDFRESEREGERERGREKERESVFV